MQKWTAAGTSLGFLIIIALVVARRESSHAIDRSILRQQVVSGEVALVPIEIEGGEIDRIEKVVRSCGCMRVLSHQREEMQLPFEIPPGERKVIYMEVATAGRAGSTRFNAEFRGASRNVETSKTVNIDLDILPGWHLSPLTIRRDNCEPDETIESEIKICRHKLATDLEIEEVIASNKQRMTVEICEVVESDISSMENGFEMVAVAKLRYKVSPTAPSDSLTIVGGDGQVRAYATIVAKTRPPQLSINPNVLYWDASDSSRIVWIEHGTRCSPSLVTGNECFDIVLGETHSESESRSVTKVTIKNRGVVDVQDGPVAAQILTDGENVVFGCGDDRVTLRLVQR